MSKVLTMPTSPNFIKSNFRLVRKVGMVSSPYTGSIRTQEYDGVFWEAEVTLPPMKRATAVEWQAFLLNLNGPVNTFKFADPDAINPRGTFNNQFQGEARANETSATLSFTASTNTIAGASSTTYFNNVIVGDYIVISGSAKAKNNGTHKVITKANAYTITVEPATADTLVDETNKASCKVQVNVKGATGLALQAGTTGASGTLLKGDYLAISEDTSAGASTYTPVQYIMVTEDATVTTHAGKDEYGVKIQPKLRKDFASATQYVYFNPAKGLFRLNQSTVDWDTDNMSRYGFGFSCIEVI